MIKYYKNYKIEIWEINDPSNADATDFYGYRVFNPKGENIWEDTKDMGDEEACYENACQDIKVDLERTKWNTTNMISKLLVT